MTKPPFIALALALAAVIGRQAAAEAGEIEVLSWGIGAEVFDSIDIDRDFSLSPQNPYEATLSASLGIAKTATSAFEIAWSDHDFNFQMNVSHQLADLSSQLGVSRSIGDMRLYTDQDIALTLDSEFHFDSLGSEFFATFLMGVSNTTEQVSYFLLQHLDGPALLGPPADTVTLSGQAMIPAGTEFGFNYQMSIDTFGGGTSAVGMGTGHINISMQVIPEPTAGAPFVILAAPVLLGRRRRIVGR